MRRSRLAERGGTSQGKRNRRFRRVKVDGDGDGLVSRAGVALLRELTVDTALAHGWSEVLLDTCKAFPTVREPGRVLADLAVVIADGGDALAHLATLRDKDELFGTVASDATAWRCVERAGRGRLIRTDSAGGGLRVRGPLPSARLRLLDGLHDRSVNPGRDPRAPRGCLGTGVPHRRRAARGRSASGM